MEQDEVVKKWEIVSKNYPVVKRFKIDNGWLYMVDDSKSSVTFVPE